ncbi:hypothetical protein K3495_g16361, partial [Podosphaera aphanis]
MEKLRKSLKSKFGYDSESTPSKAMSSINTASSKRVNNSDEQNGQKDLGSFMSHLSSKSLVNTSFLTSERNSSYTQFHLYNHWVLDSGSDVHICNNEILHEFKRSQDSIEDQTIVSGTTKYPIQAWGSCKVAVTTPKGNAYITLNKVALIPGFMTSLISLRLMNVKNVHWNSLTPLKMSRSDGSIFCNLFQTGKHWTFEINPIEKRVENETLNNNHFVFSGNSFHQHNSKVRHKTFNKAQLHRIFGHPSAEVIEH